MIYLLPLIFCFSAFAGVGGISGGTDKFQRGSHIHFQQESTFVNVEFSRTLCTNGKEYFAILNKCAIRANDDSNECLKTEKIEAYQPVISERERCESYQSNGSCLEWKRVPFIQSPKRIIEASRESRSKEKRVIVPKCQ
jgi:hypothetical protein